MVPKIKARYIFKLSQLEIMKRVQKAGDNIKLTRYLQVFKLKYANLCHKRCFSMGQITINIYYFETKISKNPEKSGLFNSQRNVRSIQHEFQEITKDTKFQLHLHQYMAQLLQINLAAIQAMAPLLQINLAAIQVMAPFNG